MLADKDNDAIQNAEYGTKSKDNSKKCNRPFQTRFPVQVARVVLIKLIQSEYHDMHA